MSPMAGSSPIRPAVTEFSIRWPWRRRLPFWTAGQVLCSNATTLVHRFRNCRSGIWRQLGEIRWSSPVSIKVTAVPNRHWSAARPWEGRLGSSGRRRSRTGPFAVILHRLPSTGQVRSPRHRRRAAGASPIGMYRADDIWGIRLWRMELVLPLGRSTGASC